MESAISNLKLAHTEIGGEAMFAASIRDGKFEAIQMGMVKVPQLGLGQSRLEAERFHRSCIDGESFVRRATQNRQRFFFFRNEEGSLATPGLYAGVSDVGGNRQFPVPAGEIRHRVNIDAFYKCLRRNQQLHRAENASIIRPVARSVPRHHVLVEGIVHTNRDAVGPAPLKQVGDIKSEGGVTLADVFSGGPAIDPARGGVEDGLKFHAHSALLPTRGLIRCRQLKAPPIPCSSVIVGQLRLDLPGVRHSDASPIPTGRAYAIPLAFCTPAV